MNKQLQFNTSFSKIIDSEVVPKYIDRIEDIPIETIKKIVEEVRKVVVCLYENDAFYCPGCCKKLDKKFYCKSCFRDYSSSCKNDNSKYIVYSYLNNFENFGGFKYNYYKFDVIDGEVLLYRIVYKSKYNIFNKEEYTIKLDSIYWVRHDSVVDFISNKTYLYDEILEVIKHNCFDYNGEEILSKYSFFDINFLDLDSLDLLKNSLLYKYSYIWFLKDYFNNNSFSIHSLVVYPVYVKQFEYLVKMGLYNLACINPMSIEYKGNFVDTFKVQKKYYGFMKKIDITPDMLKIFRITKNFDEKFLKDYSECSDIIIDISKKININKALEYVRKNDISVFDYDDYLNILESLKMDLSNKKCIYPEDFIKELHKVELEFNMLENNDLVKKIEKQSLVFNVNRYEDEKYVIFPAPSLESIYNEGYNQHNCLRNYIKQYANNDLQLYFMRYKSKFKESFVTIEVSDNKIIQAKCKYNKEPSEKVWSVLRKWEESLIPISVSS